MTTLSIVGMALVTLDVIRRSFNKASKQPDAKIQPGPSTVAGGAGG